VRIISKETNRMMARHTTMRSVINILGFFALLVGLIFVGIWTAISQGFAVEAYLGCFAAVAILFSAAFIFMLRAALFKPPY